MKLYRSNETGLFVGRQADQVEGETYETFEFPINPKEDTIRVLNELLAPPEKVDANPPKLNDGEELYLKVRQDVAQGRVDLDEIMWAAPLDTCLRLGGIIMERTREHFHKEKTDVSTG